MDVPLSDADGRLRLRPGQRPEMLDAVRCGDCGRDYPQREMRKELNWIYGGWVCTRCILDSDDYK